MDDRSLNRALLVRQGLLEPLDAPVAAVVESIGAIQAQAWSSPPVALWSRMRDLASADLYASLDSGKLIVGPSIRGTLHLVSAAQHPLYAAVADAAGANVWWRSPGEPPKQAQAFRRKLLTFLARTRKPEEVVAFAEEWVAANPGVFDESELATQRRYKWRPHQRWTALRRVPADGRWTAKAPSALRAAPKPRKAPTVDAALGEVIRFHLRAFGPSAADDIAQWIGWKTPPVRQALEKLAPRLEQFSDAAKRPLYDLPDAPRPDPESEAPVRFLPAFDSALLAYAPRHRRRIVADAHRERIYQRANLRLNPTFLIDGKVAGLWSVEVKRKVATLTAQHFGKLRKAARDALAAEGERLLRFSHPSASEHRVRFES